MENINNENIQYRLIFNQGVNRRLIRDYHIPVADIKADRMNADKTIFVYERTPEFEKAFAEINTALKNKSAE